MYCPRYTLTAGRLSLTKARPAQEHLGALEAVVVGNFLHVCYRREHDHTLHLSQHTAQHVPHGRLSAAQEKLQQHATTGQATAKHTPVLGSKAWRRLEDSQNKHMTEAPLVTPACTMQAACHLTHLEHTCQHKSYAPCDMLQD